MTPIDYRAKPELYPPDRDDTDIESVAPYYDEIAPYFAAGSFDAAKESAANLYELYLRYKQRGDFVGMDMVRRFLERGKRLATADATPFAPAATLRPQARDIFGKTRGMIVKDPDFDAMAAAHRERAGG